MMTILPRSMLARTVLLALLALLSAAAVPATAAAQDSAPATPAGASVIVIIPDSLASVPRTVSELLRDYAPSASVQRSSGALGASTFLSLRDGAAVGGDPLIVIDGIRQVQARVSLDTLDRRSPSIIDDLMVEDIARVEILPGPAAAASYGSDGQRGAIVITTRGPGHGRPAFSASVTTSSADANTGYARNLTRTTVDGFACPYFVESSGGCTAVGTTRYTPLLDRSPFRSAQQLRGHLGAIGGIGALGYAASLGMESGSGTMEPNTIDGTVASLRMQLPISPMIRASLSSVAIGHGITYPARGDNSVLALGVGGGPLDCSRAAPCGTDSSSGGYNIPLDWLERSQPHRRIGHLGGVLAVDVDPSSSLSLRTSVSADGFRDKESLRDSAPPGYLPLLTQVSATERSWRVSAAEQARFTTRFAGAAATTLLDVHFDADRGRSGSRTSMLTLPGSGYPNSVYSLSTTDAWLFRDRFSQSLEQRLAWHDRAALGMGLLRTTTDFNFGRRPKALLDPRADAMYQLVSDSAPAGVLRALRLRSAWGRTSSEDPRTLNDPRYLPPTSYGGYGYGSAPRPRDPANRSTELEGGIDAMFGAASSRLSLTAFHRDDRLDYFAPSSIGFPADRVVTGGELLADATPIDLPDARLHLRGQLAVTHDRVDRPAGAPVNIATGPGVYLAVVDGKSWAAWMTQPTTWNDANGNGRIERNEIAAVDGATGGRSRPANIATLAGDLEILHSFTITAVLDHVGGFEVYDATAAQQCWRQVCSALNDPAASLDEQGRAVAIASAFRGAGFVVPGDATALRELSLAWQSPRAASVVGASGLRVTLSGYELARWARSKGLDYETSMPATGVRADLYDITQPIPRTVGLRVALTW